MGLILHIGKTNTILNQELSVSGELSVSANIINGKISHWLTDYCIYKWCPCPFPTSGNCGGI